MNYQPLRHGKIVAEYPEKYLVSFTYSPTMYVEDELTIQVPIRKKNVVVNQYGIVTIPVDVYSAIMKFIEAGGSVSWDRNGNPVLMSTPR